MVTLHNLTKFDDENTITCKARNQVESVWRETDITDTIRVDGELIKFCFHRTARERRKWVSNWRDRLAIITENKLENIWQFQAHFHQDLARVGQRVCWRLRHTSASPEDLARSAPSENPGRVQPTGD